MSTILVLFDGHGTHVFCQKNIPASSLIVRWKFFPFLMMKYKKSFFVILVSYVVLFFPVYETVKFNDVTCHATH